MPHEPSLPAGVLDGAAPDGLDATLWVRGSEVTQRDRQYVWRERIRRGAVNLLEGLGKVGKSTVMRAIAAELTRAGVRVLWLTTEEDTSEDVVPALAAMGADLDLVMLRHEDAERWNTDRLAELEAVVGAHKIELVVIDQLKDHLSKVAAKGEDENTVRADLTALGRLARRTGTAIVGIRHWRKAATGDAVSRGMGSGAYSNVARSILQLSKRPGGLALATIGNGNPVATLAVRLVDVAGRPHVEWGGELALDADDLAGFDAGAHEHEDRTSTSRAAAQIRRALANGPRPSAEVKRDLVARHGFAKRTIDRAASSAGIVITRTPTVPPRTEWALAPDEVDAETELASLARSDETPPAGEPGQTRQPQRMARLQEPAPSTPSGQAGQARQARPRGRRAPPPA